MCVMLSSTQGCVAGGLRYYSPTPAERTATDRRSLSASFQRLPVSQALWPALAAVPGSPVSGEWVQFVGEAQNAIPVVAELRQGSERLGFFTGLIVKKFGLPILGSPFPGWMTPYMGFALYPGVSRSLALVALERFAFGELGCVHVEIVDRALSAEDIDGTGYACTTVESYETDLMPPEERLFAGMTSACRRCVRKAQKSGILIEEARYEDASFVDDYYAQLSEGLLAKRLVPSYDAGLVRKVVNHLGPSGRLLLLRARDPEGRCIASGIYPATSTTAHVWGNVASYLRSRHLRPGEALNWYAMRYWKARGVSRFDWGGRGRYKEKYGGVPIGVLRVRKSRSAVVARLRDIAERALRHRLRMQGRLTAWWQAGPFTAAPLGAHARSAP